MELAVNTTVVERSETFTEKAFSIGNPIVIMKIMRSKLYSNPIKVLIQEYLCNARDANREAGCDKPIEIFLPTKLSQSFEVRDYGIGISPSRMENVFIKYGESTKRQDNKQTGGFGIGAKSGWSYSDSFSVTTITQEGEQRVKRFYSAIIDETEQGSLVKIGDDQVVDEPTGTRIIVWILLSSNGVLLE
jgi:DNA topoisomerase VI subunit B